MHVNTTVAIIGMGCIFPKANGLKQYWRLLFNGDDAVTDIPENSHWSLSDYFNPDPSMPDHTYCRRGSFIPVVSFDPARYGIPPKNLEATDTSQLLGLVVAEMALEDAGYLNLDDAGRKRTNIILGVTGTQELVIPLGARLGHPLWKKALQESGVPPEKSQEVIQRISEGYPAWQENSFPGLLGNVVAGRIANRLDLGGTNSVVDAACASSMSAINTAIMELAANRCDLSITGGVDALNDIFMHMCFSKTGVLSHTSDARPFSKDADGTVLGEGIGMLVLKRLTDAVRDKDRIYAIIKGIGTSSDGRTGGIYAPDADGQYRALKSAYDMASVDPATVELIEAHGTGTRVGDKIEFTALNRLFSKTAKKNSCALGSVKSMIGHTKASAGVAGIIKAALSLYHKVLPPTLKAEQPDPDLNLNTSAFYLNPAAKPWFSTPDHPRRCGVSAFGFGGSNFHAVLEEYQPGKTHVSWDGEVQIAAFSGNRKTDLETALKQFASASEPGPDWDSAEAKQLVAHQAFLTRENFSSNHPMRLLLIIKQEDTLTDLVQQALSLMKTETAASWNQSNIYFGSGKPEGAVGFLFPGQGSQYTGMGRDLFSLFPEAMEALNLSQTITQPYWKDTPDLTLRNCVFPLPPHVQSKKESEAVLRETQVAQPAIGTLSLAMIKVLDRFAVKPAAVCGHSFGELSALCAAGWISEATFLDLAAARGSFMAMPPGEKSQPSAMLAVKAPLDTLQTFIDKEFPDLILANRNSPDQGVLSGSTDLIEEALCQLKARKIQAVKLPVSAAFHSRFVDHAAKPFSKCVETADIFPTAIPVLSNTTGVPYPESAPSIKSILGNHLVQPVNFIKNVESMYSGGIRIFLELGPKSVLTGLTRSILKTKNITAVSVDQSAGRKSGIQDLAAVLCILASRGFQVDLTAWEEPCNPPAQKKMRIPLTGANIRPKGSALPPSPPMAVTAIKDPEDSKTISATIASTPATEKPALTGTAIMTPQEPVTAQAANSITPSSSNTMAWEALKLVQQGLESMQALQAQTARAHEKFLDTQAIAGRTLQSMMEQTRRFAQGFSSAGSTPYPDVSGNPQAPGRTTSHGQEMMATQMHAATSTPRSNEIPSISAKPETKHEQKSLPAGAPVVEEQLIRKEEPSDAKSSSAGALQVTLLETVSQLTGFPMEMLDLDMDIESDLGIDSIKRVEIMAQLEKEMPNAGSLTPDAMAGLKTLRDICILLHPENTQGNSSDFPVEQDTGIPKISAGSKEKILAMLIKTISSLTGFPEEMLDPGMDLESDLGIDSIKRVEIMAQLEKEMPNTDILTPDVMAGLKTLNDICLALSRDNVIDQEPEPSDRTHENHSESSTGFTTDIMTAIVRTISDLTGFPQEMLSPDMTLESDLGIDSIKRVEILSKLEQTLPQAAQIKPDDLSRLKTLGEIASFLGGNQKVHAPVHTPELSEKKSVVPDKSPDGTLKAIDETCKNQAMPNRQIVRLKTQSIDHVRFHNGAKIALSKDKKVLITKEKSGIAKSLKNAFKKAGIRAELIDLFNPGEKAMKEAAGIVILPDPTVHLEIEQGTEFCKAAFTLAKSAAPHLIQAASEKGAFFATLSFMGGTFGFGPDPISNPLHAALGGLSKTAGLEWEEVLCHSLDMEPAPETCMALAEAAVSLMMTHGPVEMGIKDNLCHTPELIPEDLLETKVDLGKEDVLIISGGAKGVTAGCAIELARRYKPTLILLGRSKSPSDEPSWLNGCNSEAAIKKALLTHGFDDRKPTPNDIAEAYHIIQSGRDIRKTLEAIRQAGAEVRYHSVDILDKKALTSVLKKTRNEFGHITALIHGAGVLKDKRITDKHPDQFSTVFDTKVKGAFNLITATRNDALKYCIFFSSVAARTGNQGQSDYAMANEILNKLARSESEKKPGCRTIAMNWGPWEGGMVTPSLKKEFLRRKIDLIPLEAGAQSLVREMGISSSPEAEVIIGACLKEKDRIRPHIQAVSAFNPALNSRFSTPAGISACPILDHHRIAGEPVVPFALLVEWFAYTGEHANPGLYFSGLDGMRLLKGIRPSSNDTFIEVRTGNCKPVASGFAVEAETVASGPGGDAFLNAKTTLLLKEAMPRPPVHTPSNHMDLKPYSRTVQEAYKDILFHGKDLQGIKSIHGCSAKGIEITASLAPAPDAWLTSPHRKKWIFDPLMLDCAFQAAILWAYEVKNTVCLPSYIANLRVYSSYRTLSDDVRIILTINEESDYGIKGYFTFLDAQGTIVASITGFEATTNPDLIKKFKPESVENQAGVHTSATEIFTRKQILAFAEGKPSEAFGEAYAVFDQEREIARLPRPPYFFMDRITSTDAPQWQMIPGGWIEAQFDLPRDGWYFAANRTKTLPLAILLEIALQPCGWLAAYAGSALRSDQRLYFRNLGGKARILKPITNTMGTLTMRSKMTGVSEAGGLIIQDFDMEIKIKDEILYQGHTNFGFFTRQSLANQTGIKKPVLDWKPSSTDLENAFSLTFKDEHPLTPEDKTKGSDNGMPSTTLRMIDRIDALIPDGGHYGKGYIKASKTVNQDEWFFKAHFYQDPVCPGSLGIESFIQLIRFFAGNHLNSPINRYQVDLTPNHDHAWIYRGQIIPSNKKIEVEAHIKEIKEGKTPSFTADGLLWVDGLCIYQMENFSISLTPTHGSSKARKIPGEHQDVV